QRREGGVSWADGWGMGGAGFFGGAGGGGRRFSPPPPGGGGGAGGGGGGGQELHGPGGAPHPRPLSPAGRGEKSTPRAGAWGSPHTSSPTARIRASPLPCGTTPGRIV